MAALVSMKRPAKADKGAAEATSPQPAQEQYGWGLQLRLENFELDKLGMALPKVGTKVTITASAEVVSVHESVSKGNKGDRGVQLQITDLAIGQGDKDK